jgi:hypothetical protein
MVFNAGRQRSLEEPSFHIKSTGNTLCVFRTPKMLDALIREKPSGVGCFLWFGKPIKETAVSLIQHHKFIYLIQHHKFIQWPENGEEGAWITK